MTSPNQPAGNNMPPRTAYVSREAISAFVSYALIAFEAHGEEFATEDSQPDFPSYRVEDLAYDPSITPNLTPFRTVSVAAHDLTIAGGPSYIDFNFDISPPSWPQHTVVKYLTLWEAGEVEENVRDYSEERRSRDPDEPTKPASMKREDIRAYIDYVLGKEALREALDTMEGLPKVLPQLTRGEMEDLIRLLPQ